MRFFLIYLSVLVLLGACGPGSDDSAPTPSANSSPDLAQYFPVVIVINKSADGPDAQTLTVYHHGDLSYQFPVSTGRERKELAKSGKRYFSATPVGWFTPTRTFEKYFSKTWQAQMDYSIFFVDGIAIHATTPGSYKYLGTRASGGCVRLKEEHAKIIYDLILSEGKGRVPKFTRNGHVVTGPSGHITMHTSWNTIIIVENNDAEESYHGIESQDLSIPPSFWARVERREKTRQPERQKRSGNV